MSDIDSSQEGEIDIKAFRQAMDEKARLEREVAQRDVALKSQAVEFQAQMAGLPTGTGAGKAFIASYDGELNADAIRSAAVEFGLLKPEGADANQPTTPADQARVEADRQVLTHSGLPPDVSAEPPAREPGKVGLDAFDERMQRGDTRERASAEVISRIIDAAVRGDERVLVKPWSAEDLGQAG